MSTTLIQLNQVEFQQGSTCILDPIDLSIHPEEILTLVGPNGAGKSTLLKIILGLLTPTQGTRTLAPNTRFGYVPQRFHVENTLPLSVGHFLKLQLATQDTSILERLHITKIQSRPLHSLSGGELQRVLLARALLRNPTVLVLDELNQGIDWASQEELYAVLAEVRQQTGCAMVLVSHDPFWVMAGTDRVVCLNRHICCQGTPKDISQHATFQAIFPSRTHPSLAWYDHHHDHKHDWHGNITPGEKP